MIKKIRIEQLRPGMFIHDLNCRWLDHPFLKNRFYIRDERSIRKIAEYGIREIYIDTDRGIDVIDAEDGVTSPPGDGAPWSDQGGGDRDHPLGTHAHREERAPLREEILRAREIKRDAKRIICDIMDDVRFGRPVRKEKVEHVVDRMIDSIFRNQDALISLAKIKKVDEYTYMHSVSVCVLCLSFGRFLGLSRDLLREFGTGAMLHDIGKIKVPYHILNSSTGLSKEEYEIIKRHVEFGYEVLCESAMISETSLLVVRQHHERLNGTGYPLGLKGGDISHVGRIVAIADVYDAMTSRRNYQKQFHPTEVMKRLYQWSGELFDPELVQRFIKCMGIYPVGTVVKLSNGFLAIVTGITTENLLQPTVRIFYDTRRETFTPPFTVNLSEDTETTIIGYEPVDKWNIPIEQVV